MSKRDIISTLLGPLPRYARQTAAGQLKAIQPGKASARETRLVAWQDPLVDYAKIGFQQCLPVLRQLSQKHPALCETIPSPNEHGYLATEADVVKNSEDPLIFPALRCLQHLFGGESQSKRLAIRERRQPHVETTFVDISWEYLVPGSEDVWQTFAVLELKDTNVIHPKAFAARHYGVAKVKDSEQLISAKWFEENADKKEHNCLLVGNPLALTKQAKKYSRQTPFVAIFDWDWLMIVDFRPIDGNFAGGPNFATIAFLQQTDKSVKEGDSFGMRLLGFLVHALQETLKRKTLDGDYL